MELNERSPKMCFSTALLNGNPVSAASEVVRAKKLLRMPKVIVTPKAARENFALRPLK